jgi:uncharacterized membrane protein
MERIELIDVLRGISIIFMIAYNYSISLYFFGLLSIDNPLYFSIVPIPIASSFIILSGIVSNISFERRNKNFDRRYFIRGLKLVLLASLITLSTNIFMPNWTVWFGIIHFFAFTSFIIPFVIKYKKLCLISGILITIFGFYLQSFSFDFYYLLWLGFKPTNFLTLDYFPLIPWLGIMMIGIYLGKYASGFSKLKFSSKFANILKFLGRHSLEIYLIHQPLIVVLLLSLGFRLNYF